MKFKEFIEKENIKEDDLVYFVEKNKFDQFMQGKISTYNEWKKMFIFIAEKSDIVSSPSYDHIKDIDVLQIIKRKGEGSIDFTVVIDKLDTSFNLIKSELIETIRPIA